MENRYDLKVYQYQCNFKEGLADLVQRVPHPVGIVMGVRSVDPTGKDLTAFAPSSPGWPEFTRISPILNWSYRHVWLFLHGLELDYCPLYDQGYVSGKQPKGKRKTQTRYTSMGCARTTKRNPALQDPKNPGVYFPAYMLTDETLERAGRL